MSTNTHVLDLLPGYVLDCLDEEDYILVTEHLAVCSECQAELHAHQAIADQLVLAAPEVAPSPELKHRLMKRIQRPPSTAPARSKVLGWQSLVSFRQWAGLAWGATSLLLILGLGATSLLLWQRVNRLEVSTQRAMQTVTLAGTEAAPGATGLIVLSLDGRRGTLVVDHLQPLEPDQQYQLWLIQDGHRASGAVFSVSQDGYGSVWVSSPWPLSSYSTFGVSIEPAGGSASPTGDKVLGGTLN